MRISHEKKIATALVIVACLLTGALLPALAETDLTCPAAAEELRWRKRHPGRRSFPQGKKPRRQPTGARTGGFEAEPAALRQRGAPKATDGREDPATPGRKSRMPLKPRNLRSGMATTVRRIRTASGITAGRGSGPVRAQTCRAVPNRRAATAGGPALPAGGGAGREPAPLRRLSVWPRMSRLEKRPARRNAAGPASQAGIPPGRGTRKEDDRFG